MSATFTLDTSGEVFWRTPDGDPFTTRWSDLDPFTQGYVEAMFASDYRSARLGDAKGFSDLSREALALIRKDCAAFQFRYGDGEWPLPTHGAGFWNGRQARMHVPHFPPLAFSLGDEGKVRLS